MWNKIKIIGLVTGLIVLTIVGFVLGRKSNGRGVSDDNGLSDRISDSIDNLSGGNEEAQGSAKRIENGIDSATVHANAASDRISIAQDKLRSAIEILRAAKDKG
jgi:hypothetical protein